MKALNHNEFYIANYGTMENMEIFKDFEKAKKESINNEVYIAKLHEDLFWNEGDLWNYEDKSGLFLSEPERRLELSSLKAGDSFMDSEVYSSGPLNNMQFMIIGDHVYMITDNRKTVVIAKDIGNGHGIVISKTNYDEEADAADDAYRNALTCNSCAADINLCECISDKFVFDQESDAKQVIFKAAGFGTENNPINVSVAVVSDDKVGLNVFVTDNSGEPYLDWFKDIGDLEDSLFLEHNTEGEYLTVSFKNNKDAYMVQFKNQDSEKGLFADVFKNDEHFESLGYLMEEDFETEKQKIVDVDSLGRVHIYKDELPSHVYEEYKVLPNAIVNREGTNDEFLVFITAPLQLSKGTQHD